VFKYTLQTPTTRRDASYKLNVVSDARSGDYRVGLLLSELMGGYNTPDTMHNGRDRSVKVGHEIKY